MYVFNGKNYPIINDKVLNDTIEVVNLLTKSISKFTINPYPAVQSGSAVWNNSIIFFGGRNLDGCIDKVVKYDVTSRKFEILGNMPYKICNAKGEIHENKLYIVGGDLDYDQSDEILIFDLSDNNWLESFKMPIKISNHTTGIYKNIIYIKGEFNILNILGVFDINQSNFSRGARTCDIEISKYTVINFVFFAKRLNNLFALYFCFTINTFGFNN